MDEENRDLVSPTSGESVSSEQPPEVPVTTPDNGDVPIADNTHSKIYIDLLGGSDLNQPGQSASPQQQFVASAPTPVQQPAYSQQQSAYPQQQYAPPQQQAYPQQQYATVQQPAYPQSQYAPVQQQYAYAPYPQQGAPVYSPTPEQLRASVEAQKKSRRRRRNILIIVIAAVLLTLAVAVTGFVWINRYFSENTQSSSQPALPNPSASYSYPESSQSSAPSQSSSGVKDGPSLTLEAKPVGADEMTVNEIFSKMSPAVVMILGDLGNSTSLGTGIIMTSDGYIITNAHVIDECKSITVVMNDNKTSYDATVIGSDTNSDIAVLKIDATGLSPAVFGDSDQTVVGEGVVTIGNPYGIEYAQTVTDGIVSGIRRGIYVDGLKTDLIQTNAELNPGNSGGPLINAFGQVIGINSSKIMYDGDETYEGMGFAIPTAVAKTIVDQLIHNGFVPPTPVVGVTVTFVDAAEAEASNEVSGCRVVSINNDSDAYSKGLRTGDIITAINGLSFSSVDEFVAEKDKYGVGDSIMLTYWRDGNTSEISVELIAAARG